MGRRRWQQYQQLLMENVHLKDEIKQMEEKDWESSDKCNICDENSNTSQQTIDNTVPASKEKSKTKSHSSESSYETEDSEEDVADHQNNLNFQGSPLKSSDIPESFYFTKTQLNSMSSLESVASSMAASVAAVAAMNNISLQKSFSSLRFSPSVSGDVVPHWYQPTTNLKIEAASKRENLESNLIDEQPLDLSAKSCSPVNSPTGSPTGVSLPVINSTLNLANTTTSLSSSPSALQQVPVYNSNRHIFKAKPRISTMAGRRTYTEEELQAALRDIQSGKLGTRRAAVIYGIPRSTLRNKVYKLAMEKERDNTVVFPRRTMEDKRIEETDLPSDDKEELDDREDEDEEAEKELSANEEEKEAGKPFMKPPLTVEDLIRFSKQSTLPLTENDSLKALFQHGGKFLNEQKFKSENDSATSPQLPPPLYSIFPPGAAEIWGNLDPRSIAPYLSHLMAATGENFNTANPYFNVRNQTSTNDSPANLSSSFSQKFSPHLFPELVKRMMAENEDHKKREIRESIKTESNSFSSPPVDNNQEENLSSDIFHSLPLFKSSYKNGSCSESALYNVSDCNTDNRISEGSEKSTTSSPPPLSTARSDSSSPLPVNHKLGLNLRDAIAKSIGHRFQQPQDIPISHIPGSSSIESLHRVSFPSLTANSVIKSHGGVQTDDRKLCNQAKVPLPSSATSTGSNSSGKGTRPKRGKYRNYDRDSLVEAVRAVQRGEMSVHRAGSYYGVPHSTLEYKVKERHLMRPRKREPKSQPEDLKRREDGKVLGLSVNDKPIQHSPSPLPKNNKPAFTPPSSLSVTSNGLKIPTIFETPPHPFAPTAPFPFWPTPFHQLAMDYSRNSGFTLNPDHHHLLASHFVQRMQEESAKANQIPPALNALGKHAREVAESLYDGSGINGTFLDGVIRSSLDNDQTLSENLQKKTLLDQLYKKKYLTSLSKQSSDSDEENNKPTINQILAHTLLSSVVSKDKHFTNRRVDDEISSNNEKNAETLEVETDDRVKSEENNGFVHQNQSLNLESHAVNTEIKTKEN